MAHPALSPATHRGKTPLHVITTLPACYSAAAPRYLQTRWYRTTFIRPKPAEPEPIGSGVASAAALSPGGGMSKSRTERCGERIAGILSCYDRLVVTGTLPVVCYAAGMTGHLDTKGIASSGWQWSLTLTRAARVGRPSTTMSSDVDLLQCHRAFGRITLGRLSPADTMWP